MSDNNPLKDSISGRLAEERYTIPKKKKEKKPFNFQWILIISILVGLVLSLIRLMAYF